MMFFAHTAHCHAFSAGFVYLDVLLEPGLEMRLHAEGKASALEERNQQLEQQVVTLKQQLQEVQAAAAEQSARLEQQLVAAQQERAEERQALVQKHSEKRGRVQHAAKEQVGGFGAGWGEGGMQRRCLLMGVGAWLHQIAQCVSLVLTE